MMITVNDFLQWICYYYYYYYYYYYNYYYKSTDHSDASLKLQGIIHIRFKKRWYSSQKSVVRQLKRAFACRRKDNSDEATLICAGRLFHARAAATGKARSPRVTRRVGGTSSVVVSAERRWRRATNSDVGRRLSARYAGAVPCTQWYARTHNRDCIRSVLACWVVLE